MQTAWNHTKEQNEATAQARAAMGRIKWMVGQAGVYKPPGHATTHGLAVCNHTWGTFDFLDTLVVWSGGRNGGMIDDGVVTRLPRVDELVIYTFDPDDQTRLVEIVIPNDESEIDFQATGFNAAILQLINSTEAEMIVLCDRLRTAELGSNISNDGGMGGGGYSGSGGSGSSGSETFGASRFELLVTPSDENISNTVPASQDWNDLMWSQGIVTGSTGLRQVTLRIEMQLEPGSEPSSSNPNTTRAIPFFGSASYRYVYQP